MPHVFLCLLTSRPRPHPRRFWKLTLLPALPVSFSLSMAIYILSDDGTVKHAVYDDWLPMQTPEKETTSTAWLPSSAAKKSAAVRFREAAPSAVQMSFGKWLPGAAESDN